MNISDWLIGISFVLTFVLIAIGFSKGLSVAELLIYYLYFMVNIINQIIYLSKR